MTLFDAFRAKVVKEKTPNSFPSLPVSIFAISQQPDDYRELRCLITERELSQGENVLKCSPEFEKTGEDAAPDNVNITLRADGTYSNDIEKVAIWISKPRFTDVCSCEFQQIDRPDGDEDVTCNVVQTDTSDPSFILSKISDDDRKQLSSIKQSDIDNVYRLYTNEGNICRLIDYKGHVSCVMGSNESANNQLGTYFKILPK